MTDVLSISYQRQPDGTLLESISHKVHVEPLRGWQASLRDYGLGPAAVPFYRLISEGATYDVDNSLEAQSGLDTGVFEMVSRSDEDEFRANGIAREHWFRNLRMRRKLLGK